jgi:SUMO ligase MMS21 Smc5/6 complex component
LRGDLAPRDALFSREEEEMTVQTTAALHREESGAHTMSSSSSSSSSMSASTGDGASALNMEQVKSTAKVVKELASKLGGVQGTVVDEIADPLHEMLTDFVGEEDVEEEVLEAFKSSLKRLYEAQALMKGEGESLDDLWKKLKQDPDSCDFDNVEGLVEQHRKRFCSASAVAQRVKVQVDKLEEEVQDLKEQVNEGGMDVDEDGDMMMDRTVNTKCPLTHEDFEDPVVNNKCGHHFSSAAAKEYIADSQNPRNVKCPVQDCSVKISNSSLKPDRTFAKQVKRAIVAQRKKKKTKASRSGGGGVDLTQA